jgi:sugar lactone lactonase YvrE
LGLLVSLTLVLTAAVTAKEPPDDDALEQTLQKVYADYRLTPLVQDLGEGAGPALSAVEWVSAPAVPLGQPGLSFRYVQTFGVTEQPYPADVQHLNGPNGIFIDGSNNLYVAEELGSRMLKYRTSDGANLLSIGTAGMRYTDNYVFSWLEDVALDGSGNIWVVDTHRAVQYDASGNFLQQLPPDDWWNSGNDDTHFNNPCGIAFDSAGRMYIADRENHRIQVYTFTLGSPVYSTTIGVTGVSGADNAHFNRPDHITIDSSDRLYVADLENFRVQRCTYSAGWNCTTFHGTGSQGSGSDELNGVGNLLLLGLGIDSSGNVYIADSGNGRVKKCTSAGSCSIFATGLNSPADVAIDSSGNVYVSDWPDSTIRKYDSGGGSLGVFAGTSGEPYMADTARLNSPWGIAVTADGSIYATENRGYRLVKLNAAGVQQWAVGQAGVYGDDNAHFSSFGSWWIGLAGNPAVDAAGRIYVPDTGNNRIQIFNSNSTYFTTFGNSGNGNYQFECPAGVAISPVNGDIYVTDHCNQRIMVYDSSRVYKARLGVTDVSGSDNAHFNYPHGAAVDSSGNIFVADRDNHRVQKCTLSGSSYTCTTFAGVTGECGEAFDHLCGPHAIAVDASGRVYVADVWGNNRIQVFDSTGAYLTTIGVAWGANTGQMRNPLGVALDDAGNVYVADRDNHRIQKFAPGVPGWRQVNINGFGDRNNWAVSRMSVFGNYLYASAVNDATGGEVWRTANGTDWSQVNLDGFGTVSNVDALIGEALNGYLYVGTENSDTGGEIWRCAICDGTDWTRVVSGGFDDSSNTMIQRVVVFSDTLFATTDNGATGVEVWKSATGNPGSWTQCNEDGFGDNQNTGLWAAAVLNGYLYAATAQWEALGAGTHTGAEVWRTNDGVTWSQVNTDGFGDRDNMSPWLESFNGYLYALSYNSNTGAQIWRCATCGGTDWVRVVSNGFGDGNNAGGGFMLGSGNYFYACTDNGATGTEVWRTADGTSWSQVNVDGFGDSNNVNVRGGAVFKGRLFLGTTNNAGWRQTVNGGEVWQFVGYPVYLPLVVRNR